MRPARSLPPRRKRLSRTSALLALVLSGWGCQQPAVYYIPYSTGTPGCVPVVPEPAGTVNGQAAEPATEIIQGGTTYLEPPRRTTTVMGSRSSSDRVVVSEPANRPNLSWRRKSEPEPVLATSVEGGTRLSEDSAVR